MRVKVTLPCYAWHQFKVTGREVETETPGYYEWGLPEGLMEWLETALKHEWALMDVGPRVPLFIKDGREAMMFKLAWGGYI